MRGCLGWGIRLVLATVISMAAAALTLASSAWAAAAKKAKAAKPRVELFSPQGRVKEVRQATATFTADMVAVGNPGANPPFDVDCSQAGRGRWLDTRHWVFDFNQDMASGVSCSFTLKPHLKALSGAKVAGERSFKFASGGVGILATMPSKGDDINEDQVFIALIDGDVEAAQMLAHATMQVNGAAVAMRLIDGPAKQAILKENHWFISETPPQRVLLLQPVTPLPSGTAAELIWGKDIKAVGSTLVAAQDQRLPFRVRKPFTAEFSCQRVNANADCLPLAGFSLSFSAPLPVAIARQITVTGPGGLRWGGGLAELTNDSVVLLSKDPQAGPKEARSRHHPNIDDDPEATVASVRLAGPLPEKTALTITLPAELKDDTQRSLANAASFPLLVKTDEAPPLAKFAAAFGIIEAKGGALLPVTIRKLEPEVALQIGEVQPVTGHKLKLDGDPKSILTWFKKVTQRADAYGDDRATSLFPSASPLANVKSFKLPQPAGPGAFQVIGVPLEKPGLYVVELASQNLGAALLAKPQTMYVPTLALVTNLAVHLQWGNESSLVWVTALDSAQPVAGAKITIADCRGETVWTGTTGKDGLAKTDSLPSLRKAPTCHNATLYSGLLAVAQLGDDMAFVHSSWDRGIENWRFQVPNGRYEEPEMAHSVIDRSLLRAGETVHMKHVLRRKVSAGFALVSNTAQQPDLVTIRHDASGQEYAFPLQLDAGGSGETTWDIPRDAKLGTYRITLSKYGEEPVKKGAKPGTKPERRRLLGYDSGSFRVEEFRLPMLRAVVQGPALKVVAATEAQVDVAVSYISGGAAAKLPVAFRTEVQEPGSWDFPTFAGFAFANGGYKANPRGGADEPSDGADPTIQKKKIDKRNLILDGGGALRIPVTGLPKTDQPYTVQAELQMIDPNGEVQTVAGHFGVYPAQQLVAIRAESWAATKDAVKFQVAVADLDGKPVEGAKVQVKLLQKKVISHRKRLVGGFYAYESREEVVPLGDFCSEKTDRHGLANCSGTSPVAGEVIAIATTTDDQGRMSTAHGDTWVSAGDEEWWFGASDSDRIDLLAENKHLEPGDTAKIQVRSPFRTATALISVEREGILDTYVREISGKDPVVEIPIKDNYAPNVFISVLIMRGRVGEVQPTALVDLGRPAYKLGLTELEVGWRAHELKVKVAPDRSTYRVREKALVAIAVTDADGKPAAGGEIALVAVDESLLELAPNSTWDLLRAMMGRRPLSVDTATAQMFIVGKRHFGLKAMAVGGGGGGGATRELFDTLLLWRSKVLLDAEGKAKVEIPLNDSITSFRMVAIAQQGAQRFGNGSATIRTTQDLQLLSGLPAVIRAGDQYTAHVTARNTTGRELKVEVKATIAGAAEVPAIAVTLAAGEAKDVTWGMTVPTGPSQLLYELVAKASDGTQDRLKITQRVIEPVPVRTQQATLSQVQTPATLIPVAMPVGAIPNRGGVQVQLQSSLVAGLDGVRDYMETYPFNCLEQQISRAVATGNAPAWQHIRKQLPGYIDSDGLLKYFPTMERGSDVLTAYVLSIAHEAEFDLGTIRYDLLAGLKGFVEGRIKSSSTADLDARKVAALAAIGRYNAPAPTLLSALQGDANLWSTAQVLDALDLALHQPGLPPATVLTMQTQQILRARIQMQGSTLGFAASKADRYAQLMTSVDANAARALLLLASQPGWRDDAPRLARGVMDRQHNGHWDLTTANAWGTLAVKAFAKGFEAEAVTGSTRVQLAGQRSNTDWAKTPEPKPQALAWPAPAPTAATPAELAIAHEGHGKPWSMVRVLAAVPRTAPISAGYHVSKTITPIEQKVAGKWSRGDTVRVHLDMDAGSDMTWVVVDDPIPAGASILGQGLGRDSAMATQGEKREGNAWPDYEQRSFDAFRAYYSFVPKGKWSTEYSVRLNNEGTFLLPATHVEAMYAPEVFGELPAAPWMVGG